MSTKGNFLFFSLGFCCWAAGLGWLGSVEDDALPWGLAPMKDFQ
jgi:hypothetical protein